MVIREVGVILEKEDILHGMHEYYAEDNKPQVNSELEEMHITRCVDSDYRYQFRGNRW